MTPKLLFVVGSLVLLLAQRSCRREETTDAGPPRDAGTPVDSGLPPDGGSEVPPATAAAIESAMRGIGASAALASPLVAEAQALRDDSRLDMRDSRETTAREHVENGVAGDSIVTDPMCVQFAWAGLSVTITFTGCVMEATGVPLDGMLTLAVGLFPTTLSMTFTDLMIGSLGMDGTVSLRVGGECRLGDDTCMGCMDGDTTCAAMRMPQSTLEANVTVTQGTETTVTLTGVTVTNTPAGTTLNGTGTIDASVDGSFTMTSVFIAMGDCLPTSGTLVFTPSTGLPLTVTFLPATPTTGNVEVQLGMFPPVTQMLFMACPTM